MLYTVSNTQRTGGRLSFAARRQTVYNSSSLFSNRIQCSKTPVCFLFHTRFHGSIRAKRSLAHTTSANDDEDDGVAAAVSRTTVRCFYMPRNKSINFHWNFPLCSFRFGSTLLLLLVGWQSHDITSLLPLLPHTHIHALEKLMSTRVVSTFTNCSYRYLSRTHIPLRERTTVELKMVLFLILFMFLYSVRFVTSYVKY